jgi:alpha-2-macroglobulin
MSRRNIRIAAVLVIVAIVVGLALALRGRPGPIVEQPTAGPTQPPSPVATRVRLDYTPVPEGTISPIVVQRAPARGEALAPDGAVELVFDRAMDHAAVEAAFSLSPAVVGQVQWADARTLRFKPSQPLQRGAIYDVTLGQAAKSADGAAINGAFQFRFATAGFLEVGQVIPANGAQDVQAGAAITVLFNRPVVPLTVVEQQGNAPQPLSFTPAIQGKGEWLNTAIYVFHPDAPLAGGTTYTGRVAAGLVAVDGSPLPSEYSWSFATARPQVLAVTPQEGATVVPIETPITLQFNQPIDEAGARAAFHLRASDGSDVPGALQMLGETLLFTPSQRLSFDQSYIVEVEAGLGGSAGGAGLASDFRTTFRSVPLPKILGTRPVDGDGHAQPYSDFMIFFNAPIDPATVMANFQMTPPISPTQVYTYGTLLYPGNSDAPAGSAYAFVIGFGAKPSTDYAVAIGPNIADPYGNVTGQPLDITFHTDPLPPSIGIVSAGPIATYSAVNPARIGLNSVNVGQASLRLYRLPADDLKQPYYDWYNQTPPDTALLRRWTVQLSTPQDQQTLSQIDLLENSARLDPGVYLLLLDQPQVSQPQPHVLVISNVNLTLKAGERDALVWANDLQTGQPVPNLALEFVDNQGAALGTATTDADGVARIALERADNFGVIALAREPFAAVASDWVGGISSGDFGLPAIYSLPKIAGHVYTDRPIYRPGQTVNFKGVLRNEKDVNFSLPAGNVQVTINSTSGEQIYQQELALSANGSFDGSLKLADGAALGTYNIGVTLGNQGVGATFQVAAYRAPEFQVSVTPPADEIVRGTPANVSAEVSYFFGGPVASVPVQWNVLAEPYRFAPDWAGRYQFNDSDDPWRCWDCWWIPRTPPQPILSGSGTTDAQGKLMIAIPADLKDSQGVPITGSLKLTIEATATGKDNQVISGRHDLIVHSGQLYIGLAPRTYVGQAGEPQQVDLVTADTQGNRLPNQALDVEVFKYSWENKFIADANGGGQWESRQVQISVAKQTITTDAKAEAVATFTPAEGGSYRVVASARDAGGRTVRSSLFVWVAGTGYVSWRRENNDRFSLIADKTSYKPGETADILIPSPFTQPHWALITVERGGVLSHEVRKIDGNSSVYHLPITAGHVPNVYVSVTLFSPPDAPGRPADFKLGILPLAVAPDPQSLKIALTANPAAAQPGQNVTYDVLVTDLSGQPVAAELSLDLADKAVLSLLPRTPNALREAFYHRRELGISTASGLSLSAERFQLQFEKDLERQKRERGQAENTATGAAGGDMAAAAPTSAPAAEGAPAPAAMESRAAADQSVATGPDLTIREQFSDTAYWNANVTTDAAGKASLQVKLPDNLTTWVMRGVGLTGDTRVGEGTVELVASKPLLIRPVTPRFFVVGDTAELSANISNHTNSALEVQVGLATRGLTITGQLTQTVQVPANGEAAVIWPAQVQDVTSADLVFTAVSGQYGDASRPRLAIGPEGTLPVYRYSAPEVVGTGGQLEAAGSRTEAIGLPPNIDPRNGELTVRLDPSLAAGMRDGLDYLEHFDYECTEQTVSRFLPNVLTARALAKLGIANAELEARLPGLVDEGLNRLYNQQHQDGGWGWWVDSASNPHVSSYVVFGLVRAKENGFTVREDVLSRGLDYLTSQLVATGRKASDWPTAEANQQAWLLYVLGEAGRPDSQRLDDLYASREKLSTYARAFLAMAMQKAGAQSGDAKLKTLLSDINSAAILSATGAHWEENENDWWSMNTDTRTTAIVLAALVRLDPANQLNPNVVRWLMVARKDGIWETTQESAWALMALTDWMDYTGELKADYDYGVWLNNQDQTSGHIGQADVQKPIVLTVKVADLLKDAGNQLTIGRGAGNGRLYYTAHLRAFLPVEQIKALDRGVSVRRRYVLASCQDGPKCPEVSEVKLGDVIRVELEIIAPHDLYYVQLEDPLPAGAEAIDTGLATTSQLAQEPGIEKQAPGRDFGFPVFDSQFWWGWRWYSRSELRDEKVALFADYLSRGSYLYSYTMRATLPGEFHVIPTTASELYFPEVYGRGDGQLLRIGK